MKKRDRASRERQKHARKDSPPRSPSVVRIFQSEHATFQSLRLRVDMFENGRIFSVFNDEFM